MGQLQRAQKRKMKYCAASLFLAFVLTGARANYEQVKAVGVGQDASFSGPGQLECYGAMRVYDLAGSGDAECFPVAGMPAPQGFVMDGDSNLDGTYDYHMVITDNHGMAMCEGDITYERGDLGLGYCGNQEQTSDDPLEFCGYFKCTGTVNAMCKGMVPSCFGPNA